MNQKLYTEGLIGKKLGMTQVFEADGTVRAATAVEVGPCIVLDIMSKARNGYDAVQLGFGPKKMQRVNRARTGQFKKVGQGAFYHVKEVRCNPQDLGWTVGQALTVEQLFKVGDFVDVCGTSLGKGFAGVVKRFRVKGQPATRGTHEYRRHIGAIGCRKYPGRVMKNKRMPGHDGNKRVTMQNLKIVGVKPEMNVLLVQGGIPGGSGSVVTVRRAVKKYQPAQAA